MSISVHDYHLFAYHVDGKLRRIKLQTEYPHGEPPFKEIEVTFEGVLDHYLFNAILPSILFDIEEVEVESILAQYQKIIDCGHKQGGWPSFWKESIQGMVQEISAAGCKMYRISSSFGLDGWIAAQNCNFQVIK